MQKINENMTVQEVLEAYPETVPVFLSFGMHCLGCPGARGETVGEAAVKHGNDADEMIAKLNEAVK